MESKAEPQVLEPVPDAEPGVERTAARSPDVRVLKFGGTSVQDAERIRRVASLIRSAQEEVRPVVVVSAIGGATNVLIQIGESAGRGEAGYEEAIESLEARHREILDDVAPADERDALGARLTEAFDELRRLARGAHMLRECTLRTRDRILAFGEQWSSMLVSACLRSEGIASVDVDAREIFRTDNRFGSARIRHQVSKDLVNARLPGEDGVPVVTGFIAATDDGETTTLGRGASDYTATLLGAMLGAESVEIWTDVDGVLTADPRSVPEATPLREIGYEELLELAQFGAKVMCPPAVEPARRAGIPLRIRSTLDPSLPGTLVTGTAKADPFRPVRGISALRDAAVIRLEGLESIGVTEACGRIFRALGAADVESLLFTQDSSAHTVTFAVPGPSLSRSMAALRAEFRRERESGAMRDPVGEHSFSILAIVGEGMRDTPGIAGRLFSSLGAAKVNVHAVAQGSSERNISWVVSADQEALALRTTHRSFFAPPGDLQPVRVLVLGTGSVGAAFLDQLGAHGAEALAPHGIQPVLVGIANSRGVVADLEGLDASHWREAVASGLEGGVDPFRAVYTGDPLVVVDCTASPRVADRYEEFLSAGTAVVTANKIPLSRSLAEYRAIQRAAAVGGGLHHETTVGAGLPTVRTVAELRRSGDHVLEMAGVLSGTLTFIFDEVNKGRAFSAVVADAKGRGISEPDPRDDLGLMDVVRKLVILARTAGFEIEPDDVSVAPLLPTALLDATSVEEFMAGLPALDQEIAERSRVAREKGCRLACVARIDASGARVQLEEVEEDRPQARIRGTENVLEIRSERYSEYPILIQGPGAGPKVTASGLMTDLVAAAERVTHGLRKPNHDA